MTKIVLPAKTPDHLATETALHVACDRIMRADDELKAWRWACLAFAIIAAVGVAT